MRNTKQGISLIVLVITIIVMIILAAAVIISLENAGIIKTAHNAVCMTNIKQAQNLAVLTWSNIYTKPDEYTMDNIEQKLEEEFEKNGLKYEDYNVEVSKSGIKVSSKAGCTDTSGVEGGSGAAGKDENIDLLKSYIFKDDTTGRAYLTELSEDGKSYKENTELGIAEAEVNGIAVALVEDGVVAYIEYEGNKYKFKIDSNMNTVPSYGLVRIQENDFMFAFTYDKTQDTWVGAHDAVTEPTGDCVAKVYYLGQQERVFKVEKADDVNLTVNTYKMVLSGTGTANIEGLTELAEGMYENNEYNVDLLDVVVELELDEGITKIDEYFWGDWNAQLEKIIIPDSVIEIGESAFDGCEHLKEFNLPNTLNKIGQWAFRDAAIENVIIPGSIKEWGTLTFEDCTKLKSVTIKDGVTSIPEGAFSGCTALENITFANTLTSIDSEAFSGCESLKSINLPSSLTQISSSFSGCTSLENVTIPGSVQRLESSFMNCTKLKSVIIEEGATSVGGSAFMNCSLLDTVKLPSTLTEIGGSAFVGCTSLTSLVIPKGLTEFGMYPFSDTLTSIKYKGTTDDWNAIRGLKYVPSTVTIEYNYSGN